MKTKEQELCPCGHPNILHVDPHYRVTFCTVSNCKCEKFVLAPPVPKVSSPELAEIITKNTATCYPRHDFTDAAKAILAAGYIRPEPLVLKVISDEEIKTITGHINQYEKPNECEYSFNNVKKAVNHAVASCQKQVDGGKK